MTKKDPRLSHSYTNPLHKWGTLVESSCTLDKKEAMQVQETVFEIKELHVSITLK